jgi:hypothetical protein
VLTEEGVATRDVVVDPSSMPVGHEVLKVVEIGGESLEGRVLQLPLFTQNTAFSNHAFYSEHEKRKKTVKHMRYFKIKV